MAVTVRRAGPQDAETIVRMVKALCVVTQDPPACLTDADILRDGFGAEPWFLGFIAERDGEPLGLAIAQRGYATDMGLRGLYITELFIDEEARGQGVGRSLMQAVARQARDFGGRWVGWDVSIDNEPARAFYDKLGARCREDVRMMILQGEALEALARDET